MVKTFARIGFPGLCLCGHTGYKYLTVWDIFSMHAALFFVVLGEFCYAAAYTTIGVVFDCHRLLAV